MPFPWMAAAMVGSSLLSYFGRNKNKGKAPMPADYEWQQKYGPGINTKLMSYGSDLLENPYGIPEDIKSGMRSTARDVSTAGLSAATRGIDQAAALSGRSAVGGEATRGRYYAGEEFTQNLTKAYRDIDMADYLAREEQRNRGANLLLALSNKSPVYAQIASQNYWNQINAANENDRFFGNLLGGTVGNIAEYYMNQRYMDQMESMASDTGAFPSNPYSGSSFGNSGMLELGPGGQPTYPGNNPYEV